MTPARTKYAVPNMDDARELARMASEAIEAAMTGEANERELADQLFRAIYGANHLPKLTVQVEKPAPREVTVTCFVGDPEKWQKITRTLGYFVTADRILIVRNYSDQGGG